MYNSVLQTNTHFTNIDSFNLDSLVCEDCGWHHLPPATNEQIEHAFIIGIIKITFTKKKGVEKLFN